MVRLAHGRRRLTVALTLGVLGAVLAAVIVAAQTRSTTTATPPATPQTSEPVQPTPSSTSQPTSQPTTQVTAAPTPSSTSHATGTPSAPGTPGPTPGTTPHTTPAEPVVSTPPVRAVPLALRVSGNRLVNGRGATVRLLGVNRSGTQYACIEDSGFFDGPVDDTAVRAMVAWRITAVRVSLNEDCWLAINGAPARWSGSAYQANIHAFVSRLHRFGLYVILDLHWNAPGTQKATDQQPMPDRDHAPAFWHSVAASFRSDPAVAFDLYNEPFPDSNNDTTAAWRCVRNGGSCPGVPFVAAGSQELVNAVRSAGARNVVLVGGPQYAGVVDRWSEFAPTDSARQLAASIHIYGPDWSPCWQAPCWNSQILNLSRRVPIVVGEMGDKDCTTSLIDPLMKWADTHGVSYLAWAWFTGSCADEPALITSYSGAPTPYGVGLKRHLQSLGGR